MANLFDVGETVVCSATVYSGSTLTSPSTSMAITIVDPAGVTLVSAVAMTNDSTGAYHYDYQTAGLNLGVYTVTYIATNGTRITFQKDTFKLE